METNRPEVLAEVWAAYRRYEDALLAADAATLDDLFWRDGRTIRYGADEILYGHPAIAAFNARRRLNPERVLVDTVVTSYGADFATASTLFTDVPDGRIGRQMQSWVRMPDGWRVVAAHVSVIDRPKEIGR
ncbi:oxalurate catabolism protein HpxZ [Labrys wisconsinensis]|nr:oxalurate catabolism protein HpxZ [Labrys wisconsinensis]